METATSYIDTHCHLYSKQFDHDRSEMIQRAMDVGVTRFLLPNVDSESLPRLLQTTRQFPKHCLPMMGLHPCSVSAEYKKELDLIAQYLFNYVTISDLPVWYAVGEIGLDYYWDTTFIHQQQDAFRQQIRWAKQLKLPIVVHARNSMDDNLKIIEEEQDGTLKGILHCFTGTLEQARKGIALGMYLGIGGVVTFKNAGVDAIVSALGVEHIVLETDAPYLAPVPHRGKRNESAYLPLIAEKVAMLTGTTKEQVAQITSSHACRLFALQDNK